MRQWKVDPKLLCNKHLLGEHVEHHMFLGTLKKGISIKGYISKGLLEVHSLKERHDQIAIEMESRGMNHKTPFMLDGLSLWNEGYINENENIKNLFDRCLRCRERIDKSYLL